MTSYPQWHAAFRSLFWSGLPLMNFALFLHPLDPLDFLVLARSDPFAGFSEPYGFGSALLFWISALACAIGAIGMLRSMFERLPDSKGRAARPFHA